MLNLIKNELIKLFNKKTIYIMIVLVVLLSIFTMYIANKQNKDYKTYNKVTLNQIESLKLTSKTDEEKATISYFIREYSLDKILSNKEVKKEIKNYFKNELLRLKFNYYGSKIAEEYLSKNIKIEDTYFYKELKNYILNIASEDIKEIIKKDINEYNNLKLNDAIKLLKFYSENNIDFSSEKEVEKYNELYNYKLSVVELKKQIKDTEKNIKSLGEDNKKTQTYKNLLNLKDSQKANLKNQELSIKVIESELKNKIYSSKDNLLIANATNVRNLTLFFVLIGMIAISASIVSEEYSKSTIKLLLIRPYSREKILLSKYITTLISMFILLLLIIVVPLILNYLYKGSSIFGSVIYGNILTNKVVHTRVIIYYINLVISFIPMILMYTTLAFFISVLTMSSSIANMLSFGIFFVSQILEGIALIFNFSLIKYSFTVVSDYTSYVSMTTINNSMYNVAEKFNLTLFEQNITYIIYMIVFLTLSFVIFKKRDIKNI